MKQLIKLEIVYFLVWGFTLLPLSAMADGGEGLRRARQQAEEVFAFVESANSYVENLLEVNHLPVGIKRTISNIEYSLAVSNIRFYPEYAELTVWGKVRTSLSDRLLFFGAQEVKLSYTGDIIGDARLVLLTDEVIPISGGKAVLTLKGGMDTGSGQGISQTYMAIDCSGYKELGIAADVTLSERMVVKVNGDGRCNEADKRVTTYFSTVISDWNDILISVSLPPFMLVGLDGFVFEAQETVFDFSDTRNAANVRFPEGYEMEYMIPGSPNLWRGIYINTLTVTLPPQFARRSSASRRVSFSAQHLLFDENGVSGRLSASNLLSYEEGVAGLWPFSVETFYLDLLANHLRGAGFTGELGLPLSSEKPLGYEAYISPGNEYLMKVILTEAVDFPVWAATAHLLPNSYIQMEVKDGKFRPEAMLNGWMGIQAGNGGAPIADLKKITFRRLNLKTEAPYFMVDYMGYDGEMSLNGFPISLSHIALQTNEREAGLGFDIHLKLSKAPFALKADTRLCVVGAINEDRGLQSWKYKRLDIGTIGIDTEMAGSFSLKGQIGLNRDDPTYGNGFAGNIEMILTCCNSLAVKSRVIFGRKDFRYWLVDGSAMFGVAGVPVFPPVSINGIGGGAYYKMSQQSAGESVLPSGAVYVPDNKRGLELKTSVLLSVGSPGMMNGEASFEIAFTNKGGLAYMGFFGQARVLCDNPVLERAQEAVRDKLASILREESEYLSRNTKQVAGLDELQLLKMSQPTEAARAVTPAGALDHPGLMAALGIQYDFSNRVLHSTFDIYVNVLGILKGRGEHNCAGHCVLHVAPDEWYMHMGTPQNRLGVELDLAGLVKMKSGAYFMTGTRLEGSPPPPRQVADILGVELDKLDYMRDFNVLGKGGGFAFGTDFSVGTGDITFLILYANFETGLGFDIMLRDYGELQCKGRNGPVGINGWYANGQAYAYLQGECGVNLKLFFVKKKIPIIKAGAATLFQAKLPNPSWFKGYLGVKFNLLGGLVKGNIRLKLTFGEECELMMPGGSPLGFPVIGDISPEDGSTEVDVFAAPQVAFNMAVGKNFELEEDKGPKQYRLTLDRFSVTDGGVELPGEVRWNTNRDAASFYSHDVLPPQKELKVSVRVGFEEYRNGQWEIVYSSGQKAYEEKEITLTTSTAPDNIPLQNVDYAYPVVGQRFYLPGEGSRGYVCLKRGQPYLFTPEFEHKICFRTGDAAPVDASLNYDASARTLRYVTPSLDLSTAYSFSVVTLSKGEDGKKGGVSYKEQQLGGDGNEITVKQAQAEGEIRTDVGKVLLEYEFSTSAYRTLAEKIRAGKSYGSSGWRDGEYFHLNANVTGMEPFDQADLAGNEYTAGRPLLTKEAVLDDYFYRQVIYPMIYEHYPYGDVGLAYRDPEEWGVPPVRALRLMPSYLEEVEAGNFNGVARRAFPVTYDLYEAYIKDHSDLRNRVVNRYLYQTSVLRGYEKLVEGYVPVFPEGKYHVRVGFRQPDGTLGSSAVFEYIY